jgi:hypothetical protein
MFPDSLANMWAFSRQPGRGLLKTEVQNRLSFFLIIFFTFCLRRGGVVYTEEGRGLLMLGASETYQNYQDSALSNRLTDI